MAAEHVPPGRSAAAPEGRRPPGNGPAADDRPSGPRRALNLAYDAAFDWSPDDPRLPALADRTRRWLAGRDGAAEAAVPDDESMARLAAATAGASSPALLRIAELIKGDG